MMTKEKVQCPECKGLCVIGTSVGGNPWRGRTYDCDVCHGTGYVNLFNGMPPSQKIDDESSFAKKQGVR
jgi:hypothetical protein